MSAASALLLADSRTPTGSYAHSAGLEAAVANGLRADEVPSFVRGRLATVALTEAALSAAAIVACREHADPTAALLALDDEALARCPAPPLRAASAALGRGLLRTGCRLFPHAAVLTSYRDASAHTPRPVAFGAVAFAAGLAPVDAALVALHDDAATVAAAAVKLLPVDGAGASAWVAALAPELNATARAAADAAARGELPSLSAPLVELRSVENRGGRLFAS